MNIETRNKLISLVLGIVIIVLGYFLYRSIVAPYQVVIEKQKMTERVRHRMSNVRDALVQYESRKDKFPENLDSLVKFLKTDSIMVAQGDSLLESHPQNSPYNPDSIIYSPRNPDQRFEYTLNDTIRPNLYLLEDPDTASDDRIGHLTKTTWLNAASWE